MADCNEVAGEEGEVNSWGINSEVALVAGTVYGSHDGTRLRDIVLHNLLLFCLTNKQTKP